MVHEVNEATLAEEEFLSNHVYLYRRGQGLSLPLDDSAGMIPASALKRKPVLQRYDFTHFR